MCQDVAKFSSVAFIPSVQHSFSGAYTCLYSHTWPDLPFVSTGANWQFGCTGLTHAGEWYNAHPLLLGHAHKCMIVCLLMHGFQGTLKTLLTQT